MSKVKIAAPPLGWNSFDSYGCHIYEELVHKELDAFAEKLRPHGYEYFVIDNGWFSNHKFINVNDLRLPVTQHGKPEDVVVDEFGVPQPATCFSQNGISLLADKCKVNGIKLGLHLMRGIPRVAVEQNTRIKGTKYRARDIVLKGSTCIWCSYMYGVDMSKNGAQEYYNSIFQQFSDWGVEFVKVDDVTHHPEEIEGYVKAMENATGDICLSLSAGGTTNAAYYDVYTKAHMLRITRDIWDRQEYIDDSFELWNCWQGLEKENFYPDLDMIPFGELCLLRRKENLEKTKAAFSGQGVHRISQFSEAQKKTFLTQRAMSASPLFYGGSIASMDECTQKLLTNSDMLECNQNGIAGRKVDNDCLDALVYLTPAKKTADERFQRYSDVDKGWIGVFNRSNEKKHISFTQQQLGLKTHCYSLHDIWGERQIRLSEDGILETVIQANGVAFYKFHKEYLEA